MRHGLRQKQILVLLVSAYVRASHVVGILDRWRRLFYRDIS